MSSVPVSQVEPATGGFQQKLGLFDATMLVAGTMIGSGIFIVSAEIARDVGCAGWLLAVWGLTGIMTILGALSYAELAAMMPHAGGQYVYLREAYSPLWGFLYGWTSFLVIQTGTIAAVAVAFAKFLGVLVPALGTDQVLFEVSEFTISSGQLVGAGVVIFLTLINCRGVQEGKWVQNIMTVFKSLALLLLIVVGLTVASNAGAFANNMSRLWEGATDTVRYREMADLVPAASSLVVVLMVAGAAMTGSLFSADAWHNVTFTAGEVKDPRRNLPLSLLLGAGMVIALYLLANIAYLAVLPVRGDPALAKKLQKEAQQADTPAARAAVDKKYHEAVGRLGIAHARDDRVGTAVLEQASPDLGVPFMAVAIMVSTFGCANGLILMGARLYYAMARDRLFFQGVGTLNRRGVPAAGLILQGCWSILLIFSGSYNELLAFVMFAVLLFYVLTVAGLFVLRRRRPDAERPYRAVGYPFLPAAYVLLCAAVMLDLLIVKPVNTWPGLILVLSGIPVYFLWRVSSRVRTK